MAERVSGNKIATILRNILMRTVKEVKAYWPNIVVKNHQEKKCLGIEVLVPTDNNVSFEEEMENYPNINIWI